MVANRKDYSGAVAMYESLFSIQDVADYYGMSRQAMWKILKRRGVTFREKHRHGEDNHFFRGGPTEDDYAQNVAEKAVLRGRLIPQPCEVCGAVKFAKDGRRLIHAHHDDYNHPLQVRWLCQRHHHEWHKHNRATPKTITSQIPEASR